MNRPSTAYGFTALAVTTLLTAPAAADVTPDAIDVAMLPGASLEIPTRVGIPARPAKLDVLLLIDVTSSFGDDLPNIRTLAPGLAQEIRAMVPDSRFGLATFADFPFEIYGSRLGGDYAYRLDQDLTSDIATWLGAVNAIKLKEGGDLPESQYEALFQAVTGAGLEIPLPAFQDGDFLDLGEIAPGQNASFRADATKIIVLLTDTSFHQPGDTCTFCPLPYPGAGRDTAVAALQEAGVKVISVKAPGASTQMDDIAAATRGAVTSTASDSSDLAQSVIDGLESVTFEVRPVPRDGCSALAISINAVGLPDAAAGDVVLFDETVTVPRSISRRVLDANGRLTCVIDYVIGGEVVGSQTLQIRVPDVGTSRCSRWLRRQYQRSLDCYQRWLKSRYGRRN